MGRFRAAADLSYHLSQALRHANQLEILLGHGIQTSDTLVMLASDLSSAAAALLNYSNAAKEGTKHEPK